MVGPVLSFGGAIEARESIGLARERSKNTIQLGDAQQVHNARRDIHQLQLAADFVSLAG